MRVERWFVIHSWTASALLALGGPPALLALPPPAPETLEAVAMTSASLAASSSSSAGSVGVAVAVMEPRTRVEHRVARLRASAVAE